MVKNFEGFFKTVVDKGIPFRVRFTDVAELSVQFDKEIDPEEAEAMSIKEAEGDEEQEAQQPELEAPEEEKADVEQPVEPVEEDDQKEATPKAAVAEGEGEKQEPSTPKHEGEGENDAQPDVQPLIDHHGEGDDEHDLDLEDEDEEEEAEKEAEIILPEFPYDVNKKMTFEDFKTFYEEEIEGRLDRRKVIKEHENPATGEDEDDEKDGEDDHEKHNAHEGEGADGEGEGKLFTSCLVHTINNDHLTIYI
jgi:hypothetical protein